MSNDKWVKLFITVETQTILLSRPATEVEGGVQVEASVMINGEVRSKLLYAGKDVAKAQATFDGFTREDAASVVDELGTAEEEESTSEDTEEESK